MYKFAASGFQIRIKIHELVILKLRYNRKVWRGESLANLKIDRDSPN